MPPSELQRHGMSSYRHLYACFGATAGHIIPLLNLSPIAISRGVEVLQQCSELSQGEQPSSWLKVKKGRCCSTGGSWGIIKHSKSLTASKHCANCTLVGSAVGYVLLYTIRFALIDTYDSANMVGFTDKHSEKAHTSCQLLSIRAADFSYLAGLNTSIQCNQSWTAVGEAVWRGTGTRLGLDWRLLVSLFTYCQSSQVSRQSAKCVRPQHLHHSALDQWCRASLLAL